MIGKIIVRKSKQIGAAFMEVAISAPVLLILLTGTVDLGRLMLSYLASTRAAYEGTRFAANIRGIPAQTPQQAVEYCTPAGVGSCSGDNANPPASIASVFSRVRTLLNEQKLQTDSLITCTVTQAAQPVGGSVQPKFITTRVQVKYTPLLHYFFPEIHLNTHYTGPSLFPDEF